MLLYLFTLLIRRSLPFATVITLKTPNFVNPNNRKNLQIELTNQKTGGANDSEVEYNG